MSKSSKFVQENLSKIQEMTWGQIVQFGQDSGFDSAAGFSALKKALVKAGVDIEALRNESSARRSAFLETPAGKIKAIEDDIWSMINSTDSLSDALHVNFFRPSEKQVWFLAKLISEKDGEFSRSHWEGTVFDKKEVSGLINEYLGK
jgi:hypothetical protein